MKLKLRILLFRLYFNTLGRLRPNHSANLLIKLFSTPRSRVIRNKEVDILKTAQVITKQIEGEMIKIYEWGSGDRVVLLFHGWESNAGSLGAFVTPLVARGYKIIAYDAPAHGYSDGERANLFLFKNVGRAIVQLYGTPEVAIGHSLGAGVIILLANELKLQIPKVVLIAPFNQMRAIFKGFQSILKIPEDLYSRMLTVASEKTNFNLNEMEFGRLGEKTDLNKVLILHDKNDQITPFHHSKSMHDVWKTTTLAPIEGSGHYKILWHKATITNVLAFIEE